MNDKEFIEEAAITALQGILSKPGETQLPTDAVDTAIIHAELLLSSIKRNNYSSEDNNMANYAERIEQLEYKLENVIRTIEQLLTKPQTIL